MSKRETREPLGITVDFESLLEAARQEGYEAGYRAARSIREQPLVDLLEQREYRRMDLARIRDIAEQL